MHRVKVRVVEDALDANNTIARANRDDFDRHGVGGVRVEDLLLVTDDGYERLTDCAYDLEVSP